MNGRGELPATAEVENDNDEVFAELEDILLIRGLRIHGATAPTTAKTPASTPGAVIPSRDTLPVISQFKTASRSGREGTGMSVSPGGL